MLIYLKCEIYTHYKEMYNKGGEISENLDLVFPTKIHWKTRDMAQGWGYDFP